MKNYIICLSILTYSFCKVSTSHGQDSNNMDRDKALNIFLECSSCDMNYFKENLRIVNYVREPALSDLQILITTLSTGSGGTEYNLIFIGRKRFVNINDTIVFSLSPDYTEDETRSILLDKINLGMVPYIMKTAYANNLSLFIDDTKISEKESKDSWKSWIFELNGSGSLYGEKLSKSYFINGSLYAGKITPKIKFETNNNFTYSESHFVLPMQDTVLYINSFQRDFSSSNLFVKSLGNHFGVGGTACFRNSQVSNLDFQMKLGPAIEYNLFKYADASTKQLRFIYSLGYEHSNYSEITIYDKLNDYLYTQNLNILFMYIKDWGYFNASLIGSSYLHDLKQYSLGTNGLASIRITNGLSFNVSFGLYIYQDRVDLRKGSASLEEILMSQREMESNYNYTINFGISYRFGSKFNNTVNPRFER